MIHRDIDTLLYRSAVENFFSRKYCGRKSQETMFALTLLSSKFTEIIVERRVEDDGERYSRQREGNGSQEF